MFGDMKENISEFTMLYTRHIFQMQKLRKKERRKRHISRTVLDQNALKTLTEKPLPTKKVRTRKKILEEKERASIRA